MNRKFLISSGVILLSVLCTFFLGAYNLLPSILLIVLAYIKHIMYPIKKELLWFVLVGFSGAVVEILLVNFGASWTYSNTYLFGIPLWLPLFWGVISTTIIVLYDSLILK